ncbi:MAG: rubrerythrin [Thermoplasmata archaeon M9B1D]|nr:MAG: rubrerythrin [Thermoplasmata archaeon M9B1D]PNX52042.1 MAG: rubrerythrin [Thermoplasmata archaeon M8B2D]
MSFEFNIDEILEIAEQIERNGARFYRNAAQKIPNVDKKRLLINLAEMEDNHEQIFKTMRKNLSEDEKMMTSFDPEDETSSYLKALADTRIFYEKEIDFSSIKEILKSAITAEKDSIVFYLGMKDVVSDHIGKDKIDAIIREEMSHIKLLSKELIAYNSE